MSIYLNCKSHINERGDCSVVALAYGMGISYDEAHRICKKHGRKDRSGFCLRSVFKVSRGSRQSRQFMGRRIGYHTNQHITLERFARLHPTGRYIIGISQHYCALIDGKVHNQHNKNVRIKYYFYISNPKNNASKPQYEVLDNSINICEETQCGKATGE